MFWWPHRSEIYNGCYWLQYPYVSGLMDASHMGIAPERRQTEHNMTQQNFSPKKYDFCTLMSCVVPAFGGIYYLHLQGGLSQYKYSPRETSQVQRLIPRGRSYCWFYLIGKVRIYYRRSQQVQGVWNVGLCRYLQILTDFPKDISTSSEWRHRDVLVIQLTLPSIRQHILFYS